MPMSADSKRTVFTVLIWVGAALFAVILALVIGNALGDEAERLNGYGDGAAPEIYEYDGENVAPVNAPMLELRGATNDSFAAAVDALTGKTEAVSLVLRESGAPNYRSEIAKAVTGTAGGSAELEECVSRLVAKGIYVSGCFYVAFDSAASKSARDAAVEYEAALICEAARAGVDEILLMGIPTDSEGIATLSELCKRVREKEPELILGAAVSYTGFKDGNAAALLESLTRFADFCAIDTVGALASGTNAAAFAQSVLYYFERYPLRLLIEDLGAADREAQTKALAALGIYNVQSVSKFEVAG